jgi:CTP:molybdopterin cytidylyltransferase MocA
VATTSDELSAIAIIPSCNNTRQLLKVLGEFKEESVDEICVVIDGASVQELGALKEKPRHCSVSVHVICNSVRKGVGLAIKQGIQYAQQKEYNIAVIMAGNGKDHPNEIPRILTPIHSHKSPVH